MLEHGELWLRSWTWPGGMSHASKKIKQRAEIQKKQRKCLTHLLKTRQEQLFCSFSESVEWKEKQANSSEQCIIFFKTSWPNTFHRLKCIFFKKKINKRQNQHLWSLSAHFLNFFSLSSVLLFFFKLFLFAAPVFTRTSLWNCKAGYTVQVRKEPLGSTYNHLQVCGHWYSAAASTESSVCIRNEKNSCRLMHRNGRKSWRLLHQEVGLFAAGLSWQTLDLHHGAADQCPNVLGSSQSAVWRWSHI